MKDSRILMGMPITVEIGVIQSHSDSVTKKTIEKVFQYFDWVDKKFSPFKTNSELSQINAGALTPEKYSLEMQEVLKLCEETKKETQGYFDITKPDGKIDTSGLVKGWAIWQAAKIIAKAGFKNYFIDAGGDIQTSGVNTYGKKWQVGIRNPFNTSEVVKVLAVSGEGVATSGNYERGLHIYNPKTGKVVDDIASITVIGPNIYEADRFATAAFVMGKEGINFIENQKGLEGYMIDKQGVATYTRGLEKYVLDDR